MFTLRKGGLGMLAVSSLLISGVTTGTAVADGQPDVDSVVAGDAAWYEQAYENTADGQYTVPEQSGATGPQRAPFGTGSHQMVIGQYKVQTELYRTNDYDGLALGDLTRLEYSTFARHAAGGTDRQPAYLRLSVDNDNNGSLDTSLYFFPGNNGAVVNGQWQNWDVANGLINEDGDSGVAGTTTLANYAAAHPTAVLVNDPYDPDHDAGALSLIAGDSNLQTRGEYFVDRVIVGENGQDTLFDLGPNAETQGDSSEVTVDPAHARGWAHQAYDDVNYLASNQEFVNGPTGAPLGAGSLRFALSNETNPDRVELFRTTRYDGTLLRDLRTLEYSTFQRANEGSTTPQQPALVRLSVDNDDNGSTDDTLFFYPANNGLVQQSAWQAWDAASGVWGINGDQGPAGSVSLAEYVVAHPDATIVENADGSQAGQGQPTGGLAFLVGGSGTASQMNGEYFVDGIEIGAVDAATGSTSTGTVFDLEPTPPTMSIGDVEVSERNTRSRLVFPVSLSGPAGVDVDVDYSTADGTAIAGDDYTATSGTLTIPAGETTGVIVVDVLSDRVRERNEGLTVTLSSPSYGTLADASGSGTIVNDDTRVGLELRNLRGDRVRAIVDTLPDAPDAPVKVFRITDSGGRSTVLDATLDDLGRINRVLQREFRSGSSLRFVAVVRTENGAYQSQRMTITVD